MNWKDQIAACIFDLDGVIVDTARYHFKAWREIAHRLDFDFNETFNEQLKGVSRVESLKLILQSAEKTISDQEFQSLLIEKNNIYLSLIEGMDKTEILPGVLPYLIRLSKNNIQIGLGSASKNAKTILKRIEIIDFFDIISDGNTVSRSKPDPEVFYNCSDHFGLDPKKCVVFEDSINGIKAANNGGFKSVGIGDSAVLHEANIVYSSFQDKHPEHLIELFQFA